MLVETYLDFGAAVLFARLQGALDVGETCEPPSLGAA